MSGETPERCDATARRPARRPRCPRVLFRSRGASDAGARGAVGPIGAVRVSTRTGAAMGNIVAGVERGAGVGARRGARERMRRARAWNAAVVGPVTGRALSRPYAARGRFWGSLLRAARDNQKKISIPTSPPRCDRRGSPMHGLVVSLLGRPPAPPEASVASADGRTVPPARSRELVGVRARRRRRLRARRRRARPRDAPPLVRRLRAREGGEARAKRRGGGPSSHSHPAPDARRRVPRIVIDERDRHRTRRGRGPSSDVRASRDGRERRGGPSPRDDQRRVTFNTPPNTRHDAHTR